MSKWPSSNSLEPNSVMLNLCQVFPNEHEAAISAFRAGNGRMFAHAAFGNLLTHVQANTYALRKRGIFEEAFCAAIRDSRGEDRILPDSKLKQILEECDRPKLFAAGDQLPKQPPLVVYRGVSGSGASRRIDGLTWTPSLNIACCCAVPDWRLDNPCVYKATVQLAEIYFYNNERREMEVYCKPRTAKPILLSAEDIKRRAESYRAVQYAKNCEAYRKMSKSCQEDV